MNKEKPEKDVTITLRIPPRIAKDLRIKAATADKTQREFILEGLKKMGIDVRDEDIADCQKLNKLFENNGKLRLVDNLDLDIPIIRP